MSIKLLYSKIACLLLLLIFSAELAYSQNNDDPNVTESGDTIKKSPFDEIYEHYTIQENRVLDYTHLNQRDMLWTKRVWRIIDVKEKRNHFFVKVDDGESYTNTKALISILMENGKKGNLKAYNDENFKYEVLDMENFGTKVDTQFVLDPETLQPIPKIVVNTLRPEQIKQFRLKEVWFFDEEDSEFDVRILGIAPIGENFDSDGNLVSISPLFWVYYPDIKDILARCTAYNEANDADQTSWFDVFERRQFSSYITKESNNYDRRVQDYKSGLDIFFESNSIKDTHFHFEHDLWDY
jgi:gliding motility associated protien GldN